MIPEIDYSLLVPPEKPLKLLHQQHLIWRKLIAWSHSESAQLDTVNTDLWSWEKSLIKTSIRHKHRITVHIMSSFTWSGSWQTLTSLLVLFDKLTQTTRNQTSYDVNPNQRPSNQRSPTLVLTLISKIAMLQHDFLYYFFTKGTILNNNEKGLNILIKEKFLDKLGKQKLDILY